MDVEQAIRSRRTHKASAPEPTDAGFATLGFRPDEQFVALIHLGWPRQEEEPPERGPAAADAGGRSL